tara:strand:- start:1097 stop:1939 length:843 start_codon:yes stop_codon:yes gene_type:complete
MGQNSNQDVKMNTPDLWRESLPDPATFQHKYERGEGLFFGGADMTGAICLSSDAATRMGLGLARILSPSSARDVYRIYKPHLIVHTTDTLDDYIKYLSETDAEVAVIGPGFAQTEDLADLVPCVLEKLTGRVVLDADALNVFQDRKTKLFSALHEKCILTPHTGEFKRLFGDFEDKVTATRQAADRTGAVIVHKGVETVIAAHDRVVKHQSGSPYLATAGTGDVLTGVIAGLVGQGMDTFRASCAAVWIHSRAAEQFGRGLTATDLPDLLTGVLNELSSS